MEKYSLIEKFIENTLAYPNDIAIIDIATNKKMSYREVDISSAKIYRYLVDHKIGKEDVVMICLPRGEKPFIAIVGVWKAGAAYVMLETDYPAEKREFIKQDTKCKLVIDENTFKEMMECEPLTGYNESDPHDLSYIVYTSGTTGNPKGVMHEYGSQMLTVESWKYDGKPFLSNKDNFAYVSSLNFVASIMTFHSVVDAGATIIIFPSDITHNISKLVSTMHEHNITAGIFTASLLHLIPELPDSVKTIVTGAEPVKNLYYEDRNLFNCYGQSESSFWVLVEKITKSYELSPVGRPSVNDTDVCLLDEEGNLVKDGEIGEICYKHPYFRGYLNLPEKNANVFRNGYVRSGDLGKIMPDGKYLVIGRSDDMVKINGNRVEPAEIESAVKQVLGTKWVGVRIFYKNNKFYVCAYYIGEPVLSIEEAKTILSKKLVSYMQPYFYIKIDKVPLSPNGKFKRNDLPEPNFTEYIKDYVAPSNELEEKICSAMASVLNLERVGATDDFYEIGGDSLNTIMVITELNLDKLSVSTFYKGKTPQKIAKLYEEIDLNDLIDIEEQNKKMLLQDQPLSVTQSLIIQIQQILPNSKLYNLPILLNFKKDVDINRLKKAVETVLKTHPVFSCTYATGDNGTFVHKYSANKKFDIRIETVTEQEFKNIKEILVQSFNLFNEALYRIRLFKTENGGYLFFDFHHSIADGTSIRLFLDDISKAYEGLSLENDYYFVALDTRSKQSNSTLYMEANEYYKKVLSGCDWTRYFAFDNDVNENKYGVATIDVPIKNCAYQEIYKKYGVGKNAFFITVAAIALSIASRKNDILICWTYNGRNTLVEKRTIGAMIQVFFVGIRFDNKKTMRDIYQSVVEQIKNNIYYSCNMEATIPFVPTEGGLNINFLQDLKNLESRGGLSWTAEDMSKVKEYADNLLDLGILDSEDGCKLVLEYNACKYNKDTINKFNKLFVEIAVYLAKNFNNQNLNFEEIIKDKLLD